jgi:hypothetical protein
MLPPGAGDPFIFGEADWLPGQVGFEELSQPDDPPTGDEAADELAFARWLKNRLQTGYVAIASSGLFFVIWDRRAASYGIRRTILRGELTKVDLYSFGLSVRVAVATKATVDSFGFVQGVMIDRFLTVKAFSALRKMLICAGSG